MRRVSPFERTQPSTLPRRRAPCPGPSARSVLDAVWTSTPAGRTLAMACCMLAGEAAGEITGSVDSCTRRGDGPVTVDRWRLMRRSGARRYR